MQKLSTFHFGEIEFDEEKIIKFPWGLPGFPDDTRFLLMSEKDDEDMFFWLQSADNGDVAFTLMNVYGVLPDYDPRVGQEALDELGEMAEGPLEIYNIAVIPEDVRQMRVNLKAPVVINADAGLGAQVVCENEEYPIRYHIFEQLEKYRERGGQADAGANP